MRGRGPLGAGALALALALAACAGRPDGPVAEAVPVCPAVGGWLRPASGEVPDQRALFEALSRRQVVLLGESHENADHHRWQLQVLAGLYALRPDLVVGFEAFPRAVQPALERWSAGESDEAAFLREARWREVWNIDPALYLPLLDFVRLNRLPLIALNVERDLVRRVGESGWETLPPDEREGLTVPRPARPAYLEALAETYRQHGEAGATEAEEFDLEDAEFRRFVDAQLVWDRAMAEALAAAVRRLGAPLVVGIVGRGHLEHGHGVPWQLADLGVTDVAVLLPYEVGPDCVAPPADLADAVFGIAPEAPQAPAKHGAGRPRLGVRVEAADEGLRIAGVSAGSVAAEAGLREGDVILEAAGATMARPLDLIHTVARQAPGTWLPLLVRRGGETLEIVARFPPAP